VRPRKIDLYLDIVALMIIAAFTKETMMDDVVDVQLVEKWVTVLAQRMSV